MASRGGEIRVIDCYENHGQPLSHYVAELMSRGYNYGTDFVPLDAKVRSLETGRTLVETLIALEDCINAVRQLFPRIWLDEARTAPGLEALRQYQTDWDAKLKVFKDHPKHDWTSATPPASASLS